MRRRARSAIGLSALCAALGCGAERAPAEPPRDATAAAKASDPAARELDDGEPYAWQAATRSPQAPAETSDELSLACPERDAALERVAAFAALRELAGTVVQSEEVTLVMRAEGAPYVWPNVWSLAGKHGKSMASGRVAAWLTTVPIRGARRCGVAVASAPTGRDVVVGIVVDAFADLEPLPTQVHVGAWLDVKGRLLVPATRVQVLVLGPRGQAHAIPSSLDGGAVRARFHADREGPFLVQVLATVDGGPRPVAEAVVIAGDPPRTLLTTAPAPGEDGVSTADTADALFQMLNGARLADGSPALTRDTRLDGVAQAHAEAMRDARHLAHDAGDGSPDDRVIAAGFAARAVGENVAHAADALSAHRTLWRSPSHRSNLLEASYDTVGIGLARGADGTLWICEVFATRGPR